MKNNSSICKHCPISLLSNNIICSVCKIVRHPNLYQYLKSLSYFSIFSLSPKYKVDEEKLSKLYKEIQKIVHPDVCKNKDAEVCSRLITEAYHTLKNDISRAEYLLKLFKADIDKKEVNFNKEKLLKLYSIQEQIDDEKDKVKVAQIKGKIENEIQNYKKEIEKGFIMHNYAYINELLVDIKYNQAIINSINKKLNLI